MSVRRKMRQRKTRQTQRCVNAGGRQYNACNARGAKTRKARAARGAEKLRCVVMRVKRSAKERESPSGLSGTPDAGRER